MDNVKVAQVIYKYAIKPQGVQDLRLPIGAKFLRIGEQNGLLYAWFLHFGGTRFDDECQHRFFRGIFTGQPFLYDERYTYLGTVQFQTSGIVTHVFEVKDYVSDY
jgi:hypothetical protein